MLPGEYWRVGSRGPIWIHWRPVLFGCSVMSDSLGSHKMQCTRIPCPSLSPRVCSNPCPLSQWCHPTMSSCVAPFSCPQSFPASGFFPVSWLYTSGSQRIRTSASASVLPVSIQGWFPLGLIGLISLQSSELSRVFSGTVVQKRQSFGTQPFLWPSWHIHTWLQKSHPFDSTDLCRQSDDSAF